MLNRGKNRSEKLKNLQQWRNSGGITFCYSPASEKRANKEEKPLKNLSLIRNFRHFLGCLSPVASPVGWQEADKAAGATPIGLGKNLPPLAHSSGPRAGLEETASFLSKFSPAVSATCAAKGPFLCSSACIAWKDCYFCIPFGRKGKAANIASTGEKREGKEEKNSPLGIAERERFRTFATRLTRRQKGW